MKACELCGEEHTRRAGAKYCSKSCQRTAGTQRWRLSNPEENKAHNRKANEKWAEENPEKAKESSDKYYSSARGKYSTHINNSKKRGIPFLHSFEQWWDLWEPYWEDKEKYCMCRKEDKGAYEVGNVRIDTWSGNLQERYDLKRKYL